MLKKNFNIFAFTLIELLVVISIVSILLSILIPSLNKARTLSKRVSCSSLQKQWGLACLLYTYDYDNTLPYWCYGYRGPNPVGPFWFELIEHYFSKNVKYETGTWNTRGKNWASNERKCPGAKRTDNTLIPWDCWITAHGAPFVNGRSLAPFYPARDSSMPLDSSKINPPRKTTKIDRPSEWIMFMDGQYDIVYSPLHFMWNLDYDRDGKNDSYNFGSGYNVFF